MRTQMGLTVVALLAVLALPSPASACTISWEASSWVTPPDTVPVGSLGAIGYRIHALPLVGPQAEVTQVVAGLTSSCASLVVPDGPVRIQVSAYLDYQAPAIGTGPIPPVQHFESVRSNTVYWIKNGAPTNLKIILEFAAH